MTPQEIARWIRDEHEQIKVLSEALLEKVAIAPQSNEQKWIRELREAFDHLRAHMVKHMSLEGRDGYMLPVVNRRPALAREVDRLAHEHGELTRVMEQIHCSLHELEPADRLLIRDCCKRVRDLLQYLEHHEAEENYLIVSAFTDDIGTHD
ncbi:MAG: hemerythrin domain-containing protein [Planctomycetota bacterium]